MAGHGREWQDRTWQGMAGQGRTVWWDGPDVSRVDAPQPETGLHVGRKEKEGTRGGFDDTWWWSRQASLNPAGLAIIKRAQQGNASLCIHRRHHPLLVGASLESWGALAANVSRMTRASVPVSPTPKSATGQGEKAHEPLSVFEGQAKGAQY